MNPISTSSTTNKPSRILAVEILTTIEKSDAYVDKTIHTVLSNSTLNYQDKNLLTELVLGTVRRKLTLDSIIHKYYDSKRPAIHPIVQNALRIAVYQIFFLSKIPISAAVFESVQIVKAKKGMYLSKFANAILRSIVKDIEILKESIEDVSNEELISKHTSFPRWLVTRIANQFPEYPTVTFLKALNASPTITLRRNTLKYTELEFLTKLEALDVQVTPSVQAKYSYTVSKFEHKLLMHLFENKYCFVQDESASLVVELLDPQMNESILDVCAAPGGKSFAIADLQKNTGRICSNDKFPIKTEELTKSAVTQGYTSINPTTSDLFDITIGNFDKVLLDAPCSGLGVIRKKPDIKWRRDLKSLEELQLLQKNALQHCSTLVKIGGSLVYSTCTFETSENENVVEWFLQENKNFSLVPAESVLSTTVCRDGYLRTFTHIHGCDAAFGAKLQRNS